MKLPDKFKICWWGLLVALTGFYIFKRYPKLIDGTALPFDIIVFLVWVALCLIPLYEEVSLFGIKLKKEIEAIKSHVDNQIESIKTDIRNSIDIRSNFNPNIYFSAPPPPDSELPAIEGRIREAVGAAFREHGLEQKTPPKSAISVDDDTQFLILARFNLEKELRRIWYENFQAIPDNRGPIPISRMVNSMIEREMIDSKLAKAISDVYAVCSPAMHGEPVTRAQVAFVRDVAPALINMLRKITR